ncbi:TonB-dependent siderophore receptor [Aestuariibacter sp. A3R04]|uniref:TonB-dependent receptor n=1 Tax=Aestuariibacter sp. A3R04 TaxID=2841571 RepID=UPI001C08282F|nr:TonB-dependent receptor [Aestuariibacter sp. A3R04]MBU3023076.1 TonB-dependent receptor [Aestuariibacter sp. A3R04]
MKTVTGIAMGALAMAISQSLMAQQVSDIEVVEVKGTQQALDTLNPGGNTLKGIFGDGLSVADTPRAVTSLSAEAIAALNINDLHDIVKAAPNAYASSGFGTPSLPSIRGQLGELFQDGIRRQGGNNGFGLPLSFNSVEQIDVVKGPSPVLFGSTQRNGGFVNLQTKLAPLSDSRGKVTLRAGRWDQYSAQLDYGTALQEGKSGIRLSAEYLDHGSFYDFAERESTNLFVAYRYAPSDVLTWSISAEYYDTDYPDNAGINRPTQDLIDNGIYITGQGVQANGSTVPGAGAIVSPMGEVVIPRNRVFTHPDDVNGAETTVIRSNLEYQLADNVAIRNITYYQYLEREEIAQNSFVEIIDGADTFENRTELDYQWSDKQLTTVGFALRYNDVLGYSQFTTEADNPIDLTGPISNRVISLTDAQKARLVELRPGVFVSPGAQYDVDGDGKGDFNLSDTTDSASWQTGLVFQQRSTWTEKFSTIGGIRIDYYDVAARDPLAPEGVEAASDNYSDTLTSYQLSAVYKLTEDVNFYAAFSESDATSNSMAGGTVLGGDNEIDPLNFATENTLYEIGVKYAPQSYWYAEAALFDQTRSLRNRDGSNSGVKTQGFELQVFYQADDVWINAAYSYLDARFDDAAAFQDTAQVTDVFDSSRPDIIQGSGVGSPSFAAFPASDSRVQGIPPQIVSINVGWKAADDFQVGASALYTKSFPLDFLQTVHIRDQYTIDLNADYEVTDDLRVRLDVINVTDEENWQPVFEGGYFGATLVMPNVPRHAQLTMQYAF